MFKIKTNNPDIDKTNIGWYNTYINLNDNTSAGIECKEYNAFSVQYHPESSPGPHDSRYLFGHFKKLMKNNAQK